jgi:hypothetical protein
MSLRGLSFRVGIPWHTLAAAGALLALLLLASTARGDDPKPGQPPPVAPLLA